MTRADFGLKRQRGIGLVAAIFLITVIALLSVALTRSIASSAVAGATDVQRLQALLAAEAGAQLGANAVLPPAGSASCIARTVDLSDFDLPNCEAIIACRVEVVGGRSYYTVESTGTCLDGASTAASRTVAIRLQGA